MSDLRKRLEAAREAHRAARYPGDLDADVPAPRASLRKIAVQGAVVAAGLAAVVLLVFRMGSVPSETPTGPQALAPADESTPVALVFAALAMPEVPEEFASPATPLLSFSAPTIAAMPLAVQTEFDPKETI